MQQLRANFGHLEKEQEDLAIQVTSVLAEMRRISERLEAMSEEIKELSAKLGEVEAKVN